jgi:hypothetical protein
MRTVWPLVLAVAGVALVACSSSSSSPSGSTGGTGDTLPGTWCGTGSASAGFTFSSGTQCFYEVPVGGATLCGSQCTYQVSGSTLTLVTTTDDGGTTSSTTCTYGLTYSNGGNTLEIKSTGGTGCTSFDVTVNRSGLGTGNSCSFGC